MSFALLSNGNIQSFKSNIIGFPTSDDEQFVLTRVNDKGTILYSWTKPVTGLTSIDFITTVYDVYLKSDRPVKINIKGDILIFDIIIENIPYLCNNYEAVNITVNNTDYPICKWNKYQQIIVDNDNQEIMISSNINEDIIRLTKIHRV